MKKYIALIIAVLLIPSVAFSAGITERLKAVVAAKNGGGGAPACDTIAQESTDADTDAVGWGNYAATHSIGTQFTASKDMTVCKLTARLFDGGTITDGTIVAAIYLDDGSNDITGSAIGGNSNSINAVDLTGSNATYTFDGMSASLTNGLTYWVVLTWDGTTDATNRPFWQTVQWSGRTYTGSTSSLSEETYNDRSTWWKLYE